MRCNVQAAGASAAAIQAWLVTTAAQKLAIAADYILHEDGCDDAFLALFGIFDNPTAGQNLQIRYKDDGAAFRPGAYATLELVKLPD